MLGYDHKNVTVFMSGAMPIVSEHSTTPVSLPDKPFEDRFQCSTQEPGK